MHTRGPTLVTRLTLSLVIFGLFSASIPGCGGNPEKSEEAGAIPEVVKQSNDNMENFMKSQQKK